MLTIKQIRDDMPAVVCCLLLLVVVVVFVEASFFIYLLKTLFLRRLSFKV